MLWNPQKSWFDWIKCICTHPAMPPWTHICFYAFKGTLVLLQNVNAHKILIMAHLVLICIKALSLSVINYKASVLWTNNICSDRNIGSEGNRQLGSKTPMGGFPGEVYSNPNHKYMSDIFSCIILLYSIIF
jgi:hypothetical protein